MPTLHRYEVLPSIPEPLQPLLSIAKNLWWSWNEGARALFSRIEPAKIEAMIEASKEDLAKEQAPKVTGPLADDPISETITYDDFAKIDLRVALIKKAEAVPEAEKLLSGIMGSNGYEGIMLVNLNAKNKAIYAVTAKEVEIDEDGDGKVGFFTFVLE